MTQLSIAVALLAGFVSFLSPCILPLIPGYLAYLGGASLTQKPSRRNTFLASIFFVLGFGVVFSALGVALNTVLEAIAYDAQLWLGRVGGVIIVLFGLYLLGVLKLPFLEKSLRLPVRKTFESRYLTSFVFGAAFAAGWTPCVGVVLGSILGLAVTEPGSAFTLLFAYSVGLGVPFLLVGLFADPATRIIGRYGNAFTYITKAFGAFLVIIGILAFTQTLSRIANLELIDRIFIP